MSTKRPRFAPGFYSSLFSVYSDDCFNFKYRPDTKTSVLMGTYGVERVVAKRFRGKKAEYFIKWQGYSSTENTWEPEEHLTAELIAAFHDPYVDPERVDECKERLALLLEKGLKSPNSTYDETLVIRHDVIRSLFPKLSLHLDTSSVTEEELVEAGLASSLKKCLTVTGGGCSVITPLKMKMFLGKSPIFLKEDGSRKLASRPIEKVKVTFRKAYHRGNTP